MAWVMFKTWALSANLWCKPGAEPVAGEIALWRKPWAELVTREMIEICPCPTALWHKPGLGLAHPPATETCQ